jgi:formylglycine-generating enzyme required for sulfatase activity
VGLRSDGTPDIDWVEVAGGEFIYQAGESYAELPTFYIARYPITVAQYAAFVEAGGYQNRAYWTEESWAWRESHNLSAPALWQAPKWHILNHPVVGVTWYEAGAFCVWLARRLGLPPEALSLPTEFQWEKAARGVDGRFYPWGNVCESGYANFNETYAYYYVGEHFLKRTTAVGAFVHDCSPYGVMDMCGNVREWTLSPFYDFGRVIRGGSWFSNRHQAQTSARAWFYEGNPDQGLGFRVTASLLPPHDSLRWALG